MLLTKPRSSIATKGVLLVVASPPEWLMHRWRQLYRSGSSRHKTNVGSCGGPLQCSQFLFSSVALDSNHLMGATVCDAPAIIATVHQMCLGTTAYDIIHVEILTITVA